MVPVSLWWFGVFWVLCFVIGVDRCTLATVATVTPLLPNDKHTRTVLLPNDKHTRTAVGITQASTGMKAWWDKSLCKAKYLYIWFLCAGCFGGKLHELALTSAQPDQLSFHVRADRKVWEYFLETCHQNKSLLGITWAELRASLDRVEVAKNYVLNPLAPEFVPNRRFHITLQVQEPATGNAVAQGAAWPYFVNQAHPFMQPNPYQVQDLFLFFSWVFFHGGGNQSLFSHLTIWCPSALTEHGTWSIPGRNIVFFFFWTWGGDVETSPALSVRLTLSCNPAPVRYEIRACFHGGGNSLSLFSHLTEWHPSAPTEKAPCHCLFPVPVKNQNTEN